MFASRRYHRVSQQADSDVEEVTLYELTSSGTRMEGEFGRGVYNHDRDLDLPRIRKCLPSKAHSRPQTRYHLVMAGCLCAVVMCILLSVSVAIIMYGIHYQPVIKDTNGGISSIPQSSPAPPNLLPSHPHSTVSEDLTPTTPSHLHSSESEDLTPTTPSHLHSSESEDLAPSPTPFPLPPSHPHSSMLEEYLTPPSPSPLPRSHHHSVSGDLTPSPLPPSHPHSTVSEEDPTPPLPSPSPTRSWEASTSSLEEALTDATQPDTEQGASTSSPPEPTAVVVTPTAVVIAMEASTATEVSRSEVLSLSHEGGAATPTAVPPHTTDLPSETTKAQPDMTQFSPTPPPPPPSPSTGISWEREFMPALTEGSVQLYDMNQDGTLDVVVMVGFSSCDVRIVAMDGSMGDVVWEQNVTFPAFAMRCELDVDLDGVPDCLVAGRYAGFVALSGVDGRTLWSVDPSIAYPHYNFLFPLTTRDLDGDGVPDLLNIHGGDSSYRDSETERSPAFLVAVSGRTGQKLMERVPVPDGRESYMSPILHTFEDELEVVVFGTGGETLPGSLWAVSMKSIQARIQEYTNSSGEYSNYETLTEYTNYMCSRGVPVNKVEAMRPKFDASDYSAGQSASHCPQLIGAEAVGNSFGLCVYRLLQSRNEGIMLPPVLVDMNGDGREDLVVSTFDGQTSLLDGRNATLLWDVFLPGTETYSIPAPLYYTPDATPDLLVRVNRGHWMEYDYSYMAVLDGRDGSELWTLNSTHTGMMSGLSLQAHTSGEDAMVFIALGRQSDSQTPTPTPQTAPSNQTTTQNLVEGLNALRVGLDTNPDSPGAEPHHEGPNEGEGGNPAQTRSRRSKDANPRYQDQQRPGGKPRPKDEKCRSVFEAAVSEVCRREEWWEVERVHERERRHGEDEEDRGSGVEDGADFIEKVMEFRDPPETWDQSVEGPFPDPTSDLEAFLEYCGFHGDQLAFYLYILTRDVVEGDANAPPLVRHDPIVYIPPSSPPRGDRHAPSHHDHGNQSSHGDWKEVRCAHIVPPAFLPSTPAIGDLNGDGRLEIAYVVLWASEKMPPQMLVKVFTLEDRFDEVYGQGVVDFSRFLPAKQQPWLRYMGTHGDNVYTHPGNWDQV